MAASSNVPAHTDVHFHLLAGVDDGPEDDDESVSMARAAAADGTRCVVATPHIRRDSAFDVLDLPDRVRELRELLRSERVDLSVACGGELAHDMVGTLVQSELEAIAVGPPGGRWLLLETPFDGLGDDVCLAADELRERGFGVVLAHPERAARLFEPESRSLLSYELARGTVPQINVWSLTGGYGAEAERAAVRLIRERVVGVMASDAHPGWRQPLLTTGEHGARVAGLTPREARRLISSTPAGLLERGLPRFEVEADASRHSGLG